jgi:hypothetical protein
MLPEGLKTSMKTPPRSRLPPPKVKTDSVSFQDAVDIAPGAPAVTTSYVDNSADPDQDESPDPFLDSSIYYYPWAPIVNSVSDMVHP